MSADTCWMSGGGKPGVHHVVILARAEAPALREKVHRLTDQTVDVVILAGAEAPALALLDQPRGIGADRLVL